MTKAEEFLKALEESEDIRRETRKLNPKDYANITEMFLSAAKKFGYETTKEEMSEAITKLKKESDNAGEAEMELSIEELEKVSGGGFWDWIEEAWDWL